MDYKKVHVFVKIFKGGKKMGYKLKNNRGMIADPITFSDASGLVAREIATLMSEKAKELGIPARITTDTISEGGLFGNTYDCVVINHPNPPQQYFTDVYIINGNTINFYFFGESKANTATNKANARKNTIKGMILNSIAGSHEMAYQQELVWHNQIYEIFESFIR